MIGLRSVVKAFKAASQAKTRGFSGLDQMGELLSTLGMEVDVQVLEEGQLQFAFQHAAQASVQPGATTLRIRGRGEDGTTIEALFVGFAPPDQISGGNRVNLSLPSPDAAPKKVLDLGTPVPL